MRIVGGQFELIVRSLISLTRNIEAIAMKTELSPQPRAELLAALQARFDANQVRHPGLAWAKVQAR